MSDMSTNAQEKLNSAIEKGAETTTYIKSYIDNQLLLKRSQLSHGVGKGLSMATLLMIGSFMAALIFFFSMIALGFYFSSQFDSFTKGFLTVAGIVLLVFLVILLLRKFLINKPLDKMAHQLFLQDQPEINEEELKTKISTLEKLIEETSKEIPNTVKGIEAKDFLPNQVVNLSNNSLIKTGLNLANSFFIKNKGLRTVINTATNIVNSVSKDQ